MRCVLESTISKKSAAVGTGAIAFRPLVAIVAVQSMKNEIFLIKSVVSNSIGFPRYTRLVVYKSIDLILHVWRLYSFE